jgi:hypothetical protein
MNKVGRPRMAEVKKQKKQITIYFTEKELKELNESKGEIPCSCYIKSILKEKKAIGK